jgi:hypothetical protein
MLCVLKLSEFDLQIGATTRDLHNWLDRLSLRTSYATTVSGSARRFSFENVLELALINAYVRVGVAPQPAVALAEKTLQAVRARIKIPDWDVFAAGNFTPQHCLSADKLEGISFYDRMDDQVDEAPCFSVVCVGEVVRRVKRLFADIERGRSNRRRGRRIASV